MTPPFGLAPIGACQHAGQRRSLTLSGGLEIEGLETSGERRGVDDVHAVLVVVLPVQHDGHHEDRHGDDPGSQAGVEGHVVGVVHT